jgi:predicted DNA-binding transcriptional regulator AlpA
MSRESAIPATDTVIPPALMTDKQTAAYVAWSRARLWQAVATEEFPQPVRLPGRATRWRRADVDQWIEALPTEK